MKKLILEIEVEDFNTEGMEECLRDVGEPDTALVDYLQDDLMRREVALGLGAFLSDDWQIVGRTGHIVGARLSASENHPASLGEGREPLDALRAELTHGGIVDEISQVIVVLDNEHKPVAATRLQRACDEFRARVDAVLADSNQKGRGTDG